MKAIFISANDRTSKCLKGVADNIKAKKAVEFMRAYDQQGPWPDMLRGIDVTYILMLYTLPSGIFCMDLNDSLFHR